MNKKIYVKPETMVIYTGIDPLMVRAESDPIVRPGGDNSGVVDVIPLDPDPDDTDIMG